MGQYRKHNVLTQLVVIDLLIEFDNMVIMKYYLVLFFFWPVYLLIPSDSTGQSAQEKHLSAIHCFGFKYNFFSLEP